MEWWLWVLGFIGMVIMVFLILKISASYINKEASTIKKSTTKDPFKRADEVLS